MEDEYNLQMTSKDVVRVLKAIEEAKGPRHCSIDDMAQYVDEALAICLADPKIKAYALFKELQKTHAIEASDRTRQTFHKNIMTAAAAMQNQAMPVPSASTAQSAASAMRPDATPEFKAPEAIQGVPTTALQYVPMLQRWLWHDKALKWPALANRLLENKGVSFSKCTGKAIWVMSSKNVKSYTLILCEVTQRLLPCLRLFRESATRCCHVCPFCWKSIRKSGKI